MASLLSKADVTLDIIKPLHKTSHVEIIGATVGDYFTADAYIPMFLAYRLANNSDEKYTQFVNGLKESLQKVLVLFFPFAGRFVQTNEGRGRQLLCNDEGVLFMESFVDANLDSVVPASGKFTPLPALNGYDTLGFDRSQFRQGPPPIPAGHLPIAIKVTRFKCGGVILGVTFAHMLCDAESFFAFLTAWTDISRTGTETKIKPDFDREQAKTYEETVKRIPADSPLQTFAKRLSEVQPRPPPEATEAWVARTLEVKAAVVDSWKKKAVQSSNGEYISTGDCIIAHMWQSTSRLPPALVGGKEIVVDNIAEGRKRFYTIPLPNLCGNVYSFFSGPQLSREEVLNQLPHALGRKVRENLVERIGRNDWFSIEKMAQKFEEMTSGKYVTLHFDSWVKFPTYEMDFGCGGGKPFFAVAVNAPLVVSPDLGATFIDRPIPGHSDSAATVTLWLPLKIMDALASSPEFLSFFLPEQSDGDIMATAIHRSQGKNNDHILGA